MSDCGHDDRVCWICLTAEGQPLVNPCKCPDDRVVHKKCLARWQLQSAGKSEEHKCRFCHSVYPSWKESLTPAHLKPAIPVVSVHYNGICYRLRVKPGPEGLASFQRQLQRITGLPVLDCMQITFQCRAPETAQELSFKGITAFDAAIHCAAISAAERLAAQKPSISGSASQIPSSATQAIAPSSGSSATSSSSSLTSVNEVLAYSSSEDAALGRTAVPSVEVHRSATLGRMTSGSSMPDVRRSLDSRHQPGRTDSAVVLEPQAAMLASDSTKSSSRIARRLREMLRSFFV